MESGRGFSLQKWVGQGCPCIFVVRASHLCQIAIRCFTETPIVSHPTLSIMLISICLFNHVQVSDLTLNRGICTCTWELYKRFLGFEHAKQASIHLILKHHTSYPLNLHGTFESGIYCRLRTAIDHNIYDSDITSLKPHHCMRLRLYSKKVKSAACARTLEGSDHGLRHFDDGYPDWATSNDT